MGSTSSLKLAEAFAVRLWSVEVLVYRAHVLLINSNPHWDPIDHLSRGFCTKKLVPEGCRKNDGMPVLLPVPRHHDFLTRFTSEKLSNKLRDSLFFQKRMVHRVNEDVRRARHTPQRTEEGT